MEQFKAPRLIRPSRPRSASCESPEKPRGPPGLPPSPVQAADDVGDLHGGEELQPQSAPGIAARRELCSEESCNWYREGTTRSLFSPGFWIVSYSAAQVDAPSSLRIAQKTKTYYIYKLYYIYMSYYV